MKSMPMLHVYVRSAGVVSDHPHHVWLSLRIILCIICLYKHIPGPQHGPGGDVYVRGAGVVGDKGPGPYVGIRVFEGV